MRCAAETLLGSVTLPLGVHSAECRLLASGPASGAAMMAHAIKRRGRHRDGAERSGAQALSIASTSEETHHDHCG
jgi:hypothetical protein